MGGYSREMSNKIQEYIHNGISGPNDWAPTGDNYYVALSTTSITESKTGLAEPTGGSYARAQVLYTTWELDTVEVPQRSRIKNKIDITFPRATSDWGTIVSGGIFDDAYPSTAFMYWFGDLVSSKVITLDTIAVFQQGDLSISSNPV
jgi:hypothetical protein